MIVTGANDVWVVDGPFGEVLIPVIDDVVHRRGRRCPHDRGAVCCPACSRRRTESAMIVDVITIFPEMFDAPLSASMVGLARERGLLEVRAHDLRDWTHDRHRTHRRLPVRRRTGHGHEARADLRGGRGGPGLEDEPAAIVVFLTPAGKPLHAGAGRRTCAEERLVMVCGRYEGFDERVLTLADLELSIGDYVLTGGELPAMVVIDAVSRATSPGCSATRTQRVGRVVLRGPAGVPSVHAPGRVSRHGGPRRPAQRRSRANRGVAPRAVRTPRPRASDRTCWHAHRSPSDERRIVPRDTADAVRCETTPELEVRSVRYTGRRSSAALTIPIVHRRST